MAEVQGHDVEPFTHGIYSLNVLTGLWIKHVHGLSGLFFPGEKGLIYQNSLEHRSGGIFNCFSW